MAQLMYRATVVIPVLRQRNDWLRQCIRSAVEQTVPIEVIVVVSNTTPYENIEAIQEFDVPVLVDKGSFASAINVGFEMAITERVGILLSDDWLEPQAVEMCLRSNADLVSTGMFVHSENGVRTRILLRERYERAPIWKQASLLKYFFLFNKEKVLEVGGVDATVGLAGPEDFDLIWTLLEQNVSVEILPIALHNYREHKGERLSCRSYDEKLADLRKILKKHKVTETEETQIIAAKKSWLEI